MNMRTMTLASALGALLMTAAIASAGDYAELNVLGFAPDGETFAFEEYGIQDGSGFPYANIYVIDTATDHWVSGTPIRLQTQNDQATLAATRAEARKKAQSILTSRQIGEPGNRVASNPPSELSADPRHVIFVPRARLPSGGDAAYDLALTEIEMPAGDCPDMGQPFNGFRLVLTTANGAAHTLSEDTQIPSSRHCPLAYGISDVLTYYPDSGQPFLVVILNMYTVGFEGPDRRFLAVTSTLPD